MDAENISKDGCSQRDSAEHKGYVRAHRSFNRIWKERDSAQPDLLEKILEKDNLNRAFTFQLATNISAVGVPIAPTTYEFPFASLYKFLERLDNVLLYIRFISSI